jgi:hypothetical protein
VPKVLRMPPESGLRRGSHRDFVEELFEYYRQAGRPTLRAVAEWITENEELAGTASPETVRRVLVGKVQPTWPTAQAILHALCALAGREVTEDRWPDDNYRDERIVTLEGQLRALWNMMIDDDPLARPTPVNDPWATSAGSIEEPPF